MFFPSIVYVCVFVSDGDPREHQISCASMRKTSTHLQLRSNGVRDETKHTPRGQSSRFQTECVSKWPPHIYRFVCLFILFSVCSLYTFYNWTLKAHAGFFFSSHIFLKAHTVIHLAATPTSFDARRNPAFVSGVNYRAANEENLLMCALMRS